MGAAVCGGEEDLTSAFCAPGPCQVLHMWSLFHGNPLRAQALSSHYPSGTMETWKACFLQSPVD